MAAAVDMNRSDWRGFMRGFLKFMIEEQQEPEHADDDKAKDELVLEPGAGLPAAAGTMVIGPRRRVLFVKRSETSDFPSTWCFPGGGLEPGESPAECAAREMREETGYDAATDGLKDLDRNGVTGTDYQTFLHQADDTFTPTLNDEHTEHAWARWGDWPQPLHPGVKAVLDGLDSFPAEDDPVEDEKMAMDPLTAKGSKILSAMKAEYGEEKGEKIFYASKNSGRIRGVDAAWKDFRWGGSVDNKPSSIALDRSPTEGLLPTEDSTPSGLAYIRLAFDFSSVRRKDQDGRLHIQVANISKATVNPYWGWEIADSEQLGLKPDKIYKLLRDPKELERAAPTFNNIQFLTKHEAVASDRQGGHLPSLIIGSTGTDAAYHHPFLRNSLVVWDKEAIDDIEEDRKRELSCAYRYRADMTPGTYEGQAYDGVMRDIVGNHVSLVREGRAGSDVVIGDSKMPAPIWKDKRFTIAMATDSALVKARDAGTSEGARKAAMTRKSHGASAAAKPQSRSGNRSGGGGKLTPPRWLPKEAHPYYRGSEHGFNYATREKDAPNVAHHLQFPSEEHAERFVNKHWGQHEGEGHVLISK